MPPLTMVDDNDREWTAIGFRAETGEMLWIPADTELIATSLLDDPEDGSNDA